MVSNVSFLNSTNQNSMSKVAFKGGDNSALKTVVKSSLGMNTPQMAIKEGFSKKGLKYFYAIGGSSVLTMLAISKNMKWPALIGAITTIGLAIAGMIKEKKNPGSVLKQDVGKLNYKA